MRKRLWMSLHLPVAAGGTESVSARDTSMNGLPVLAYWELLEPNPEAIPLLQKTMQAYALQRKGILQ